MEIDFRKKKKVIAEDFADENEGKEFEDDAQSYYKNLRARMEAEKKKKDVERQKYYAEIKEIYRKKGKKV